MPSLVVAVCVLLACLVSLRLAGPARSWARRLGLVAIPDERRAHPAPTALVGPWVILAVIIVAIPALVALDGLGQREAVVLAGAAALCLVGAIDDRRPLTAKAKLGAQSAICAIAVVAGIRPDAVTLPLIGAVDLGLLGAILAFIWLVAVVNIVNLLDGLDGLAGGVVAICALVLAILAASVGALSGAVILAATAGACVGFLPGNLRGRAFLGDAGALALGFLLAAGALGAPAKTAAAISLIPIALLVLPILDTLAVIAWRLRLRRAPWSADRSHLHHRLLRAGASPRRVVLLICAWTLCAGAFAISLTLWPYQRHGHAWAHVLWASALLGSAIWLIAGPRWRRLTALWLRRRSRATTEAPPAR